MHKRLTKSAVQTFESFQFIIILHISNDLRFLANLSKVKQNSKQQYVSSPKTDF